MCSCRRPGWLVVLACLVVSPAGAQQLEPRAFAPNPTGVSLVSMAAGLTTGDVALDPSVPIKDFEVELATLVVGYARTFALGGRMASFGMAIPYASLDATGLIDGEPREAAREGFGDPRLRFMINLLADSARDPRSFTAKPPRRTFGFSVVAVAPVGEYAGDRLVNIGSGRWAAKTEVGGALRLDRWSLEGSAGSWFFQDNDDFFGGSRKSQDPLAVAQVHAIRSLPRGAWLGFSLTGYQGGRSKVDGVRADDRQKNTRAGVALSLPLDRQLSLKLDFSKGTTTRAGGDFEYFSVGWQYSWAH